MSIGNVPHDPNIVSSLREWLERLRQHVVRPKRPIYIPVTQFSGYYRISSIDDLTEVDENIQFAGSGNPILQEINSLGIVGARIDAAGDACHHLFYVPKDLNVDTNIKFEVVWCTNSTDTSETATWRVRYSASAAGEVLSAATTALSATISADNVVGATAYMVAIAPFGLLYRGNLQHGDFMHLEVSLSAASGLNPASDEVFLLGLLINDEG